MIFSTKTLFYMWITMFILNSLTFLYNVFLVNDTSNTGFTGFFMIMSGCFTYYYAHKLSKEETEE